MDEPFAAIAELVPGLEEIRFDPLQWPLDAGGELTALVPKLPGMFPVLKTIALAPGWFEGDNRFRAMPLVTVAS